MPATRAYGGVPASERRDQRHRALVEATLDALHEHGPAGVTVRAVCARAQLTPRYFYESFADLDALLAATVDAVIDEVAERALAALAAAPADTAAQVRAAIDAGFGVVADDPRRASALLAATAGHGVLRDRRHKLVTDYADLVVAGLPVLGALGPAGRRQARGTALFLMGGSVDLIEAVLAGRLRRSRRRLVDDLTALWLGALAASIGTR